MGALVTAPSSTNHSVRIPLLVISRKLKLVVEATVYPNASGPGALAANARRGHNRQTTSTAAARHFLIISKPLSGAVLHVNDPQHFRPLFAPRDLHQAPAGIWRDIPTGILRDLQPISFQADGGHDRRLARNRRRRGTRVFQLHDVAIVEWSGDKRTAGVLHVDQGVRIAIVFGE